MSLKWAVDCVHLAPSLSPSQTQKRAKSENKHGATKKKKNQSKNKQKRTNARALLNFVRPSTVWRSLSDLLACAMYKSIHSFAKRDKKKKQSPEYCNWNYGIMWLASRGSFCIGDFCAGWHNQVEPEWAFCEQGEFFSFSFSYLCFFLLFFHLFRAVLTCNFWGSVNVSGWWLLVVITVHWKWNEHKKNDLCYAPHEVARKTL